jgi:hypothetical protein
MVRVEPLVREAEDCRRRAAEFAGRPEQPFLLRLAEEFDDLAAAETAKRSQGQLVTPH